MDPSLPTPSTQPPPPTKKHSLIIYIAGLILLCLVIIGGSIYYKTKTVPVQPSQSPNQSTKPEEPKSMTGLEIAEKTATFLDKALLSDGNFQAVYLCSENSTTKQKECRESSNQLESNIQRNGFMAQAYLELFNKTNNVHYKDNSQKAVSFILSNCSKNKQYCFNSLPALYSWYKATQDSQYKDAMLEGSSFLLADETLNQSVRNERAELLWMLYDATGDVKFKNRLESVAKGLIADKVDKTDSNYLFKPFYKEGDFEVSGYQILATNWYIAAYKATKDPVYLKAAQDIFDGAKIHLHIEDFKKSDQILDLSSLEYLLNLADVSDATKKQDYLDQAKIFAQAIVLSLWDSPSNVKYIGDYGFLSNFNDTNGANRKMLIHNAFRIRQFLRLGDNTFNLI